MKTHSDRIILISPSDPASISLTDFGPPYGLSLIAASLLDSHKSVRVFDYSRGAVADMLDKIEIEINQFYPKYIGISVQTSNRVGTYQLVSFVKSKFPQIKIVLGGSFATAEYHFLLTHFNIDYIVIGEGERSIVELINCLDAKNNPSMVSGIAFKEKGKIGVTKARQPEDDLDKIPYPAFHLFENAPKKSLMALSSRGCMYRCNFCSEGFSISNRIRFHSPEYFINLLTHFYKKYKIDMVYFIDSFFTFDKQRAIKICRGILKNKLKIKWSCMTRSDGVSPELLKNMAKAGCTEILYGVESGSKRVQDKTGKKLDLKLTKDAFRWTHESGIHSILSLMVGNTGETEETIRETMNFVKDLNPGSVQVQINRIYPGTKNHQLALRHGVIKKDFYLSSAYEAPFFTVEQSESQLNEFRAKLERRTTFIKVNNQCNNGCSFCNTKRSSKKISLSEIKQNLKGASKRSKRIVLFGGEPSLRKDFFEILAFCDSIKLDDKVILDTNGRMFIYKDFVEKINAVNSIGKIIVSLFGLNGQHDQLTKQAGSYEEGFRGIKNIIRYAHRLELQVKIPIMASNITQILKLIKLLTSLGVSDFKFVFIKDLSISFDNQITELPRMTEVVSRLKKVKKFLSNGNKMLSIEGLPLCASPSLDSSLYEPHNLFDEYWDYQSQFHNYRQLRIKDKIKFKQCFSCKRNDLCEGVWKSYLDEYGDLEFKSIKV